MSLKAGEGLDEAAILAPGLPAVQGRKGPLASWPTLPPSTACPAAALQAFVDTILSSPASSTASNSPSYWPRWNWGWKARTQKELALMTDLVPLLKKRAGGRDISGLQAYED